jgi:hypothetical protein
LETIQQSMLLTQSTFIILVPYNYCSIVLCLDFMLKLSSVSVITCMLWLLALHSNISTFCNRELSEESTSIIYIKYVLYMLFITQQNNELLHHWQCLQLQNIMETATNRLVKHTCGVAWFECIYICMYVCMYVNHCNKYCH